MTRSVYDFDQIIIILTINIWSQNMCKFDKILTCRAFNKYYHRVFILLIHILRVNKNVLTSIEIYTKIIWKSKYQHFFNLNSLSSDNLLQTLGKWPYIHITQRTKYSLGYFVIFFYQFPFQSTLMCMVGVMGSVTHHTHHCSRSLQECQTRLQGRHLSSVCSKLRSWE